MNTIAKEEILRLNCPGFGQQSDLTIGNARALDTYKAIFVNPTSILHLFDEGSDTLRQIEAAQKEGQMEFSLPSDDLLSRLNDEAIVRTEELVKFLEGGGLLIYFLCRPFKLLGPSLNMDNYFWLLTLAPDKPAKSDSNTSADRNMSTAAQGRNIETTPDAEDSEFAHYFTQTGLEWSTVIRTDFLMEGYTALALAGTKKCIAAELFAGDNGGRVVFLPAPYSPDFDKTLIECTTLWYNRKSGEEITMEDVRSALGTSYTKSGTESTTERVQAAQVEAAKEELIAREKAVAEKLSIEMAATEREVFAKSRQNMSAAKAEGGASSASTGTATVAKGESQAPAKPASGTGSNGPSKPAAQSSAPPPIQKTESGLVVPKLDKTLTPKPVSSGTTSSGTETASKPEVKEPEVYDKAEPLPTPKVESAPKRPGSLVAESLLKELEESANRESQTKAAESEKSKPAESKSAEPKPAEPKSEEPKPEEPKPEELKPEAKATEPDKPKVEPEKPQPEPEKPKAEPEKPKPEPEKPKAEPEKPKPEPEKPKAQPEKPEPQKAETAPPKPIEKPVEKPAAAPRPAEPVTAQTKESVPKFESKTPAPEWVHNFPFPGLDDFKVERGSLYEQIRQLQTKINNLDDKIAGFDSIKNALLAGEGEDLVNVCKKTFTKLGWSTKPAGNEEELWLCVNDEPEAVVRIVRSPDQAKRGDLAQLDLACTKFWEENGREAKGILLISTWTKGGGPDEPEFPTPVAEFAEKHNLCLLTSAQLLSAFRELELGKGSGEDLRKKISATNGPLKGFTL